MMSRQRKRRDLLEAAAAAVEAKAALMEKGLDEIIDLAAELARVIKKGGKIYLAGNGGSAADCQHFATELVVRLTGKYNRRSIPGISLTADSALLTAAGNDFGFERIFERQVEGLVTAKDLLFLISTSGRSENLARAAAAAKKKKVRVFALLGQSGGKLKKLADRCIIVPSDCVQRIQEEHIFIIHNLVALVEKDIKG